MRTKATCKIIVGEHEIFDKGVADKLIGGTTKDGWLILDAKLEDKRTIKLTIEKDLG